MKLLDHQESSELFTKLAYEDIRSADEEFVDEIAYRAGGLPLVLEIWGRYFKSHECKQWPTLLQKLRRIPHEDVQKKLQVSYHSLSPRAKKLFLDIACVFDGMDKDYVIKALEDEDNAFFPNIEIQHLIDKGLVREDTVEVRMHAVIRDMGREVVRQENEDDLGQRSRLVDKDVIRVLKDCLGTDSVRSIYLNFSKLNSDLDEDVVTLQVEALRKMRNLRFIRLVNIRWSSSYSSSNDETLSPLCFKHLKYLEWYYGFPCKSLDKFDMGNVVVIRLLQTKLEILWEGFKSLKKLRILDVRYSSNLKKTGSFIGLENLEELYLTDYHGLEELDGCIGCLQKLVTLNLSGCGRLKELNGSIGYLQNLVTLNLAECPLKRIPWESIDKLTSLAILDLNYCPTF